MMNGVASRAVSLLRLMGTEPGGSDGITHAPAHEACRKSDVMGIKAVV